MSIAHTTASERVAGANFVAANAAAAALPAAASEIAPNMSLHFFASVRSVPTLCLSPPSEGGGGKLQRSPEAKGRRGKQGKMRLEKGGSKKQQRSDFLNDKWRLFLLSPPGPRGLENPQIAGGQKEKSLKLVIFIHFESIFRCSGRRLYEGDFKR